MLSSKQVPKKIHYVWPSNAWCPLFNKCIDRAKMLHPDWEIIVWKELPKNLAYQKSIEDLFERNLFMLGVSLTALQIINEHGGVYLNNDILLQQPLDDMLPGIDAGLVYKNHIHYGPSMLISPISSRYFTCATRYIPHFIGMMQHSVIPDDTATMAKLFYMMEEKHNIRPTAFPHHFLPEIELLKIGPFSNKHLENPKKLPSYCKGIRMVSDYAKHHYVSYSMKDANDYIDHYIKFATNSEKYLSETCEEHKIEIGDYNA